MDITEIFKYVAVTWREICQRKFKVAFLMTIISFAIMFVGMLRPPSYSSSITIYADNQNIIKPLLGSKASVTELKQNRSNQVRDIIYSPRILSEVIDSVYGENAFPAGLAKDIKISQIRSNLSVEGKSGNYIQVSYKDDTASRTFELLNKVVSVFIEDSADTKRQESRSAYNFIDQQTASYKDLLLKAEEKLKSFQSSNFDGTEEEVNSRIASLRASIEEMNIQVQESNTRVWNLQKQLSRENKLVGNNYESSVYQSQLRELKKEKAALLINYEDSYPAIVDINYKINDLENTLSDLANGSQSNKPINSGLNPLYGELRSLLSAARIEHQTLLNRLKAFNELLDESYERRKRIANNKAELSELTRDYSVFQQQYEEMLTKKEKARISMVLDIQGQGVNYKLQEAAAYPNTPIGARFIHFFVAGPIVALLIMIAIFVIKIVLDSKIRFTSEIKDFEGVSLLAGIPHALCNTEKRRNRVHNTFLLLYYIACLSCYVAIAVAYKYGASLTNIIDFGAF
ncbi:XrtA system polysaccharide chain length determinant [Psychromonas sp. SR45-3]|uniref:XrtA system polysaccharide chain length determinant n=1 Tax=Psychromonas sp. SR45-3 TaxID=2760930 RepID=UPI0015F825CE|nr:XrtA system polysaccharide chain length determinant [Psychromonas sp. SR45-3]MBB1273456.1 chain length-determining protein [Psychromonas sp. SR45-3]